MEITLETLQETLHSELKELRQEVVDSRITTTQEMVDSRITTTQWVVGIFVGAIITVASIIGVHTALIAVATQ